MSVTDTERHPGPAGFHSTINAITKQLNEPWTQVDMRKVGAAMPVPLVFTASRENAFETYGRFVKMFGLDALVTADLGGKVARGGAKDAQSDDDLRRKIRLFKRIQAGREDALEALNGDLELELDKEDAPARLALGGLQDITVQS